ncbi:MAG: transposase [Verrucomicrobia bacterium]|nr:transposase [Verrucomicrobiota bacterium]
MGQAVGYALGQWESLQVYLRKPEIEIDNNLIENAIRPTALGKKNWLFFGDADAGS